MSTIFVVTKPKPRKVVAASLRDFFVHHFISDDERAHKQDDGVGYVARSSPYRYVLSRRLLLAALSPYL
jgi:hypothetical protein